MSWSIQQSPIGQYNTVVLTRRTTVVLINTTVPIGQYNSVLTWSIQQLSSWSIQQFLLVNTTVFQEETVVMTRTDCSSWSRTTVVLLVNTTVPIDQYNCCIDQYNCCIQEETGQYNSLLLVNTTGNSSWSIQQLVNTTVSY